MYILNQIGPLHIAFSLRVESVDPWDLFSLPQYITPFP